MLQAELKTFKPEKKVANSRAEYDTPWKNVLSIYFEQFIAYCWPNRHSEINWSKGYKSLDTALPKIVKNAPIGNRIADKLIEVHLKNGRKACIMVHIEIQGDPDSFFENRMFTYRYRIRDSYNLPIASMAILIDKNKNWRPNLFREEFWDSSIEMRFPIIKIIDYKDRILELEASSNPFAAIILAQLAVLEKSSSDASLVIDKVNLIRWLYGRGWKKEDVIPLLIFIDWVFALPTALEVECRKAIEILEEEMKMNYVTSFERMGIQKGESTFLLCLLQHKFKEVPEFYRQKIEQASDDTLLQWGKRVLNSKKLDDVFRA